MKSYRQEYIDLMAYAIRQCAASLSGKVELVDDKIAVRNDTMLAFIDEPAYQRVVLETLVHGAHFKRTIDEMCADVQLCDGGYFSFPELTLSVIDDMVTKFSQIRTPKNMPVTAYLTPDLGYIFFPEYPNSFVQTGYTATVPQFKFLAVLGNAFVLNNDTTTCKYVVDISNQTIVAAVKEQDKQNEF